MLLTFERLRAKPPISKAFTGVSVSEFETLLTQSTPLWVKKDQATIDPSQSATGARRRLQAQVWATGPAVGDPGLAAALLDYRDPGLSVWHRQSDREPVSQSRFSGVTPGRRRHVGLAGGPQTRPG